MSTMSAMQTERRAAHIGIDTEFEGSTLTLLQIAFPRTDRGSERDASVFPVSLLSQCETVVVMNIYNMCSVPNGLQSIFDSNTLVTCAGKNDVRKLKQFGLTIANESVLDLQKLQNMRLDWTCRALTKFPKGLKGMFSSFYRDPQYPQVNMKKAKWAKHRWEQSMHQALYSGFDAFATLLVYENITHPLCASWWQSEEASENSRLLREAVAEKRTQAKKE
eukprot:5613333-Amphidinium_carterae.2